MSKLFAGLVMGFIASFKDSIALSAEKNDNGELEGTLSFSIGESRGATRGQMSIDDFEDCGAVLAEWDPTDVPVTGDRTPAEVMADTLSIVEIDGEQFASFRMSDEKNSRHAKVPMNQWNQFVKTWNEASVTARAAILDALAETEAGNNEAAAK